MAHSCGFAVCLFFASLVILELGSASSSIRDLGIHIDADLMMRMHVQKTVSRCFAVLRQLRQIRRSVPQPMFQSLVVTLVNTRLDYGTAP